LIQSNFLELQRHFGKKYKDPSLATTIFAKYVAQPLLFAYQRPENLHAYHDQDKIELGQRSARVYSTGGHTEGHSYFFINDEDKILMESDSGCINEYTSDWKRVLYAIILAEQLDPNNHLGGHDAIHLGHDRTYKELETMFSRFDTMFRPIAVQMRPQAKINLSQVAWRRVDWAYKIGIVLVWAQMAIYCIGKFLEELDLGLMNMDSHGEIIFETTSDSPKLEQFKAIFEDASPSTIWYRDSLLCRHLAESIQKKFFFNQ
jgi:hypothetical protein